MKEKYGAVRPSPEEVAREAMEKAKSQEEGEPEKTLRQFYRALHRGDREEIEQLIQPHPDAEVLWSNTFPPAVAPLMDKIEDSYFICPLSGSESDGEVTIFAADFGRITLKRVAGNWTIDATEIIERKNRAPNRPPV